MGVGEEAGGWEGGGYLKSFFCLFSEVFHGSSSTDLCVCAFLFFLEFLSFFECMTLITV